MKINVESSCAQAFKLFHQTITKQPMANPFLDPQFEIRWSHLEPSSIEPDITLALETSQTSIDELAESGWRTVFDNTLLALESATETLERAWGLVGHSTQFVIPTNCGLPTT